MSLFYKPCYGCRLRPGCAIKKQMSAALSGLGLNLRLIDWRCETKLASVKPGEVVSFTVPFCGHDISGRATVRGIVMRWKDERKVWVYVAPGQHEGVESEVMARFPSSLTILDEPIEPVCRICGKPYGVETIRLRSNDGARIGRALSRLTLVSGARGSS